MTKYAARAWREGRWWVAEVPDVGATQARRLAELSNRLADLIATAADLEPEDVAVTIDLCLPDEVADDLARAERLRAEAATAQREAAVAVRTAASRLHEQGVSVRDIGTALGVSYQRAHQLLRDR